MSPAAVDRQLVRRLHQAYADKTEAFFTGLARAPGDPCRVRIHRFGSARTMIAAGHDWQTRATLTGDETADQLDQITAHFAAAGARCLVEWNPGNCYRPGSWDDGLGRLLLDRGFRPGGFRCVWAADLTADPPPAVHTPAVIRHYAAADRDAYLAALAVAQPCSDADRDSRQMTVGYGEADDRWHHYVGTIDGAPCCNATLFCHAGTAYLEWGHTAVGHRGRGCHAALVRRRMADASTLGCDLAFAVTDIGVPSSRTLQRAGFRLAYNYVMLARDPT